MTGNIRSNWFAAVLGVALAAPLLCSIACAETAADFYRGRTVTLVSGFAAGGGYDLYLRLLASRLGDHIAGHPTVIVQNMPGAAGLTAMNYVYNAAPRDGTEIIMPDDHTTVPQVLHWRGIRYDLRKMAWIGGMADLPTVLAVTTKAGVRSLDDVRSKQVIMATSGPSNESYFIPILLNALAGTKFKVVMGYPGTAAMFLAMKRGEVEGRVGSWDSFKDAFPEQTRAQDLVVLAQEGQKRAADLPNVPLYQDFIRDETGKDVMELVSAPAVLSRALAFAPGVPADRVAAVRQAFMDTMRDPAFLAAAKKARSEIKASGHAEIEQEIARVFSISPAIVAKTKELLGKIGD